MVGEWDNRNQWLGWELVGLGYGWEWIGGVMDHGKMDGQEWVDFKGQFRGMLGCQILNHPILQR